MLKYVSQRILDVQDLNISFTTYGQRVQILHDVELNVAEGEKVALIGQSGSGKTVTMRAIIGTLPMPPARIESGSIFFRSGTVVIKASSKKQSQRDRHLLSYFRIRFSHLTQFFDDPSPNGRHCPFCRCSAWSSSLNSGKKTHILATLEKVQLQEGERILSAHPMML